MSNGRVCAVSTLAVAAILALPANGQSVISTRSGLVHYFEGAVYLGDQPLQPRFGKFPTIAEGSELRTAQGRAEVLLTPGVFLRLGESSAIRMVANALSDTRVGLLAGSVLVDCGRTKSGHIRHAELTRTGTYTCDTRASTESTRSRPDCGCSRA